MRRSWRVAFATRLIEPMPDLFSIHRLWWGDGLAARFARAALLPLEAAYGAVVLARSALYDRGLLRSHRSRIPTISVGNLTVGGTGKTPVAAWLAARLVARGEMPAVVLRGYGSDEPLVHHELNPSVPVVVSADRVLGIAEAAAEGATVAVLDDAFQHRQARRDADIVLVSADRWTSRRRLIPAGPFREPVSALRRASLVLVTRKAASAEGARLARSQLERLCPGVPVAVVHLRLGELCAVNEKRREPLGALAGALVLAVAAVADPRAFIRQLSALGADVRFSIFPDHHAFTRADAEGLARSLEPDERAICTLKDAVKLAVLWPRDAGSLWYVSQQVAVEDNEEAIDDLLSAVLQARTI